MSDKPKFPRAAAIAVAREICRVMDHACERLIVAGSLRRRKQLVGDVEILYVPRSGEATPDGQLLPAHCNLADLAIAVMEESGMLTRRESVRGTHAFGPKNKLMVHVASGIPVDLFASTHEGWWSYLVCRTGPAEHNVKLATLALAQGYKWSYYEGFVRRSDGALLRMESEAHVFRLLGLRYREPWERSDAERAVGSGVVK